MPFLKFAFLSLKLQILPWRHTEDTDTAHWFGCSAAKKVTILLWKPIIKPLGLYMIHKHDHMKNLQILMVEVYKCLNNLSSPFTWDYFKQKNNSCNLRNVQLLEQSNCRTKSYGLNTALFKGGIFCAIINCQIILKK